MEAEIIRKFCKTLDTRLLDKLSHRAQQLLIDGSYTCLFQKYGNQKAAVIALQHFGEITESADSWVYQGDFDLNGYQSLKRMGVVTIPVIPAEEIPEIRNKFLQTLRKFPEYKRDSNDPDRDSTGNPLVYVLGGFAALGNPASFHNELVRDIRRRCRKAVLPIFRTLIEHYADRHLQNPTNFEMLFDRMMYRMVSQQPVAESWHRDVMPKKAIQHNDEVFGGWINLDEKNQYSSCIPGSHLGVRQRDLEEGFATIPKDQVQAISKFRYKFPIPAGHIVIFPQYIVHEVVAQKSSYNMMRLFTGWRTTVADGFLHPDTLERLDTQAIMPIPGGMRPPMYAANHGSFFLWKQFRPIPNRDHKVNTIEWSQDTMQPVTLIDRPAKKDRLAYRIVKRWMDSLQQYNLPKYPAYTGEEIDLYRPQKITQ